MSAYRACVLAALACAAWRLAMPTTHVLIGDQWFVVREGLDSFSGRWLAAMHRPAFFPMAGVWANPAQVTMAVGR